VVTVSALSISIARNANIAALVAERPGLALLQRLHIESSPRRRWQRDDHITHDLQISLMGKTGYGKSTFANAFCGQKLLGTSAVSACTRTAQSYEFAINPGNYLSVVDLPGMGESTERDSEYRQLYRDMIGKTDVILYLLRADQRDYSIDEQVFAHLFQTPEVRRKTLIILNGCDKIEPLQRQQTTQPSPEQQASIQAKIQSLRAIVPHHAPIIPCSAETGWNLSEVKHALMDKIWQSPGIHFTPP
jgi:predicted GTPase